MERSPLRKAELVILSASVLLYLASLTQSACYYALYDHTRESVASLGLLLIGWLAIMEGGHSWLANPVWVTAIVLMFANTGRRVAVVLSLAALVLSLSFLGETEIYVNEGGTRCKIVAYGAGYLLWNLSIGCAGVAAIAGWLASKTRGLLTDQETEFSTAHG